MIRRRSPFFWLAAALFLALAVWWALYVPYSPRRLRAAIPSRAVFVSEHQDLFDRWDAFSRNPFTLTLFSSLGVKPADLKMLTEDEESRAWFRKLASRHVVLGYVPRLGRYAEPAWVFASWVGGRSQRMRWMLTWSRPPDFTRLAPHGGRPVWRVRAPFLRPGLTLTVSLTEGMLVGCLSRHSDTLYDVLDTCDGRGPSMASVIGEGAESGALDRGWIGIGGPAAGVMTYEFSELTATSLAGRVAGSAPPGLAVTNRIGADVQGLARLFGDAPFSAALADAALAGPAFGWEKRPLWGGIVSGLVEDQGARVIALAAFADELSGRFMGIKVPTLVGAIPVAREGRALAAMGRALDRLNARYQWGLIPREVAVGERKAFAIEETAKNDFMKLSLEERPAYAVCGGWLVLASNLHALTNLLTRYDGAAEETGWLKESGDPASSLYGWVDVGRGRKTLREAIAAWSLKMMFTNPRESARTRQQLNEAKAWIDSLAPFGMMKFWLVTEGEKAELRFKMGG